MTWTSQDIAQNCVGILLRNLDKPEPIRYEDIYRATRKVETLARQDGWYDEVDWSAIRNRFSRLYDVR